jgi:hypothetical protein
MSGPFSKINTLCGPLMKTGPVGGAQQTKQYVYNIPCVCGRCYIGDTSRHLEVCIKEVKYNLSQGLLENSKLTQHVYEEGHKICWNEAKVLQIEPNATYRKYKEIAHMSLIAYLISQPSLEISPIWTLAITAEVKKYSPAQCRLSGKTVIFVLLLLLLLYGELESPVKTSILTDPW